MRNKNLNNKIELKNYINTYFFFFLFIIIINLFKKKNYFFVNIFYIINEYIRIKYI